MCLAPVMAAKLGRWALRAKAAGKSSKGATSGVRRKSATKAEPKQHATTSTFSPRMREVHALLDREIRSRFPEADAQFEYGMRGWRVPRARRLETWKGTIDPNFLHIFVAERKQGITLHYWNPMMPASFGKHAAPLAKAGFKVMVGCLQFNRKGDYPVDALKPLLDEAAQMLEHERQ